ncbi:hypothetical protein AAC387_Pa01g1994 [Persea americana]
MLSTIATLVSSETSLKKLKAERINKLRVIRIRSLKVDPFIHTFSSALRSLITHVKDAAADGNYDFKAIAGLMRFREDSWQLVRKDILSELLGNIFHYRQSLRGEWGINELGDILSYKDDCPPYDRWMTMSDMRHLISSQYNVVLYHLSNEQCLIFLPLIATLVPACAQREIAINFANRNHFIQVFLVHGHPTPPIATNWRCHHLACASRWEVAYKAQIQYSTEITSPNVATSETIKTE